MALLKEDPTHIQRFKQWMLMAAELPVNLFINLNEGLSEIGKWLRSNLFYDPFFFVINHILSHQAKDKKTEDIASQQNEFSGLYSENHVLRGTTTQIFKFTTPWQYVGKKEQIAEHVKKHIENELPNWRIVPKTKVRELENVYASNRIDEWVDSTRDFSYDGCLLDLRYTGTKNLKEVINEPAAKLKQLGITETKPWYMHTLFKPARLLIMSVPSLINRHHFDECQSKPGVKSN